MVDRRWKNRHRAKNRSEHGRYSRTQFIASFTGFAPINNPAVTI